VSLVRDKSGHNSIIYRVLFSLILSVFFITSCSTGTALDSTTTGTGSAYPIPHVSTEDPYADRRDAMVTMTIENRDISDPDVLRAMRRVPRQEFIPEEYRNHAYNDNPLPIGFGQTISQPYIVAWMTELLDLDPGDRVLEIGTGSGYQAAVLAELGGVEVYSIEIIPELEERASKALEKLGYQVFMKMDDGYFGWPENAPYDAIIVTAAPDHLPPPLVEQLKNDGRIVIPIGPPGSVQSMWLFEKIDGELVGQNLGLVTFVPLTGSGH